VGNLCCLVAIKRGAAKNIKRGFLMALAVTRLSIYLFDIRIAISAQTRTTQAHPTPVRIAD